MSVVLLVTMPVSISEYGMVCSRPLGVWFHSSGDYQLVKPYELSLESLTEWWCVHGLIGTSAWH